MSAADFVIREARLLDEQRWDEWLALFADDGRYWVPLQGAAQEEGALHNALADEDRLLASCYRASIAIARSHGFASLAFPAISTGIYGFPAARAAGIAVAAVAEAIAEDPGRLERIVFCCFSEATASLHREAIARLRGDRP